MTDTENKGNTFDKQLSAAQSMPPDTTEKLAYDLNTFLQEFDPYEYRDQVENEEEQILHDTTVIISGGDKFEGMKNFLKELIADKSYSNVTEVSQLLDRLTTYGEQHHASAAKQPIQKSSVLKQLKENRQIASPDKSGTRGQDKEIPR